MAHVGSCQQRRIDWWRGCVVCIGHRSGELVNECQLDRAIHGSCTRSTPPRLFLKMVNTTVDDDESFGDSKVTYYTRDHVEVKNAPLLRCYDAAYSEELKQDHLLLDDVSETHSEVAEKAPTLDYGLALAEGLAVLHARWWGAQRLAEVGAPIHSARHIQRFVAIAQPGVGHILNQLSAELEPHWPAAIHALYAQHPPALIKRSQDDHGFTLIHGDVGHNNILVPRVGDRPLYIIDRQPFNWSLTTWLGVYDLAYALVLDWDTATRRQYEMPILKRYHEQLIQHGITQYPWQQLYDDYRLCVAMGVYIATEYCRGHFNEQTMHVWLPMLRRAFTPRRRQRRVGRDGCGRSPQTGGHRCVCPRQRSGMARPSATSE
jgi:hypothetical protein